MFAASKTDSVSTVSAYEISRSLRFNSADSAYLNRTPASATNRRTWTWSAWVKLSSLGEGFIFGQALSQTSAADFIFTGFNQFRVIDESINFDLATTQVFRDPSAWYHIIVAVDTTQATSSNRAKLYVNGNQITNFSVATYPAQNANTQFNTTNTAIIGCRSGNAFEAFFNGYITELNWIDGQALTPSSFGETNAQTGVWQPKAFIGTYGTNGFYVNFSDNSNTTAATLGKDYSGNGNNWTPNNFSVSAGVGNDSLVDSPTSYGTDTGVGGTVRGNYATLNPIGGGSGTLTNGNLDLSISNNIPAVGNFAMTTGKWYWEVTNNTVANPRIGVYNIGAANPADLGGTANGWCLLNSPSRTYNNGSAPAYGSYSPTTGTIVIIAYDADAGKLWFGQNGTWFASGNPATGANASMSSVTGSAIVPALANGSGTDTFSSNFGQRPFAYTAPSGFKALCTQNLPTPTIGATSATLPNTYFAPTLYTGDGTNNRTITTGLQSDFVWIKRRDSATSHLLFDVIRGAGKTLRSESTNAESNDGSYYVQQFNSNNFYMGSTDTAINASGGTYVSWVWAANGTGVTNTSGSITSTVSANTTSGFSVVTFTAPSSGSGTVGHGLGVAPSMMIWKSRSDADSWTTYHIALGGSNAIFLNSLNASFGLTWGTINSTVFTADTSQNCTVSRTYVAYCFAEVAGYSKIGSYIGNGSTNGPFVYCGFRPAFILYKRASTAGNSWRITDSTRSTYNPDNTAFLYPDTNSNENINANDDLDILSNGFKIRITNDPSNASGSTYIFMAFASNPFKYSLARQD